MKKIGCLGFIAFVGSFSAFLSSCLVLNVDEAEKELLLTAESYGAYGFSLSSAFKDQEHFEKTLYWGGRVRYNYRYHPEGASDIAFLSMNLVLDPQGAEIPEKELLEGSLPVELTPYAEAWEFGGASCRVALVLSPEGREVGESLVGQGPGYAFHILVMGLIREDPQIWEDLLAPVLKGVNERRLTAWK